MSLDFYAGRFHLLLQFQQRLGVALFQFLHAPSEPLGQPFHLALNSDPEVGEPLILDRKCFDLGLSERGVAGKYLSIQRGLGVLDGLGRGGLGFDQFPCGDSAACSARLSTDANVFQIECPTLYDLYCHSYCHS